MLNLPASVKKHMSRCLCSLLRFNIGLITEGAHIQENQSNDLLIFRVHNMDELYDQKLYKQDSLKNKDVGFEVEILLSLDILFFLHCNE